MAKNDDINTQTIVSGMYTLLITERGIINTAKRNPHIL